MKKNVVLKINQTEQIAGEWKVKKSLTEAAQIPEKKSAFVGHTPRLTSSKVCYVCSASSRTVSG